MAGRRISGSGSRIKSGMTRKSSLARRQSRLRHAQMPCHLSAPAHELRRVRAQIEQGVNDGQVGDEGLALAVFRRRERLPVMGDALGGKPRLIHIARSPHIGDIGVGVGRMTQGNEPVLALALMVQLGAVDNLRLKLQDGADMPDQRTVEV